MPIEDDLYKKMVSEAKKNKFYEDMVFELDREAERLAPIIRERLKNIHKKMSYFFITKDNEIIVRIEKFNFLFDFSAFFKSCADLFILTRRRYTCPIKHKTPAFYEIIDRRLIFIALLFYDPRSLLCERGYYWYCGGNLKTFFIEQNRGNFCFDKYVFGDRNNFILITPWLIHEETDIYYNDNNKFRYYDNLSSESNDIPSDIFPAEIKKIIEDFGYDRNNYKFITLTTLKYLDILQDKIYPRKLYYI